MKRPLKSKSKEIRPITDPAAIDRIRSHVVTNIRDLLLFDLAIETGVAAKQLLTLRVKDLSGLDVGEPIAGLSGKQQQETGDKKHDNFFHDGDRLCPVKLYHAKTLCKKDRE